MLSKETTNKEASKGPRKGQFTKANAAKAALKANAVRRINKFNGNPASSEQGHYFEFKRHLTGMTESMLCRTGASFSSSRVYHGQSVIAGTFEKLFRIWCHLTGTPAPGNLRPSDLVKRVEKLGLKSFAQQAIIDAEATPSEVASTSEAQPVDAIEKLAKALSEMPPIEDESETGSQPEPVAEAEPAPAPESEPTPSEPLPCESDDPESQPL